MILELESMKSVLRVNEHVNEQLKESLIILIKDSHWSPPTGVMMQPIERVTELISDTDSF